jgi:hypothetical protein
MSDVGSVSSGVYDWQKISSTPSASDYSDLDPDMMAEYGIDDSELYVNPYIKLFGNSPRAIEIS